MKKSSAIKAVFKLKLLLLIIFLTIGAISAQKTEHYNSPLYAPKTYDPSLTTSNGLPKTLSNVGIEQKLGDQLPLDAQFKDENGNTVRLGDYFNKGKPVILALVYFECPMLCNEVLNGLTGSLKGVNFDAGQEFDVVAISFDARENDKAELTSNKKASYMERYERPNTANGWHFLTGTQPEIDKVTEAVGFNYRFDEASNQFAHAGGIMIATPDGKLARYFYGIDYSPKDVKFGIMEASEGKIGNPVEQLYLYCFHYDPSTGTYGLQIMRVLRLAAVLTILGIAVMFIGFWIYRKKKMV